MSQNDRQKTIQNNLPYDQVEKIMSETIYFWIQRNYNMFLFTKT